MIVRARLRVRVRALAGTRSASMCRCLLRPIPVRPCVQGAVRRRAELKNGNGEISVYIVKISRVF